MTDKPRALVLRAAVAGVLLLLSGSCGDPAPRPARTAGGSAETSPREVPEPGGLEAPPAVTVRYGESSVRLRPWTYCYGNGCSDGAPPPHPPDVGSPDEVVVEYPLEDWTFDAQFTPAGEECGRVQHVSLEQTGNGSFRLTPAGYAGRYDVTLIGRGNGDLFTTFTWTTPTDGPLPEPKARLAVITGDGDNVDSYGIEMELSNLARAPRTVAATITVTSREGETLTFEPNQSDSSCHPEGTVYWNGPDAKGTEAVALGGPPFTYEVEVTLDGDRYKATASWPGDEIRGNEPSVSLDFAPDLPALEPRG